MNEKTSKNILIVQTAFIGDTILASHFAKEVKNQFPEHKVHFFLRKGNESVIDGLSCVDKTWIWDKQNGKVKNLWKLISELRKIRFQYVFNLHRHANSGLITAFVKSDFKVGFRQNPLSYFYTHKMDHYIPYKSNTSSNPHLHEVDRNFNLLKLIVPSLEKKFLRPELPLTDKNFKKIESYLAPVYFVIAPASVWFTKAWSEKKFRELTKYLSQKGVVYFIGAPSDSSLCERIREGIDNTENLCGKLNLLDSAALMEKATRVFVNDSAPLHLASSVNARVTAIFCSTVPKFGYTPLSDNSVVIDVGDTLDCRPCGLHGHKSCPLGHFACSENIDVQKVAHTF